MLERSSSLTFANAWKTKVGSDRTPARHAYGRPPREDPAPTEPARSDHVCVDDVPIWDTSYDPTPSGC